MNGDEYNQYLREQVNHDGSYRLVECPSCQSPAIRNDFEACHSGTVNQHYKVDCAKCGFHRCDQDYCATCEQDTKCEEEYEKLEKRKSTDRLDELSRKALEDACTRINPFVMTEIKQTLQENIEFDCFCCFLFTKERLNRGNFLDCLTKVIVRKRMNNQT